MMPQAEAPGQAVIRGLCRRPGTKFPFLRVHTRASMPWHAARQLAHK
jgi:hypothetical protein